ncbi:hypothetical protein AYJ09_04745 [Candidatus Liberibacter solanacearum]|uniref:hypothetical protein n=1 Tax=Candidatus Liberibacter solanacearum TaxID=556287 RepID=UPI000978F31F|nr:hypothetical protein [Candidatus Liberibacter solanacearum]ONI58689.1 hypothetical protein AYJ09_04745 [Candidatus Liberibacter solanacearum]
MANFPLIFLSKIFLPLNEVHFFNRSSLLAFGSFIFGNFYWIMHCFVLPRLAFGMILPVHNQILIWNKKMEAAREEQFDYFATLRKRSGLAIARTNAKEIVQKALSI